jgi:hypothetical protein
MKRLPFRRLLSAVWVAVFALAAMQGMLVPKAMAAADGASGAALQGDMPDCSSCDQQSMADESCGPICPSPPAIVLPTPAQPALSGPGDWSWTTPLLSGLSFSPDTTPPRS